ncbi:hypothetical protein COU15_03020 [Candidatus Kaiserbacteria bacterium CG10_big_fil_rev_8_21_14_0_10_45_20]|uniref:DUF2914 domain-containing protein n=1 Tax=Candidatus Kaiserbacteria bacterium CG10_big_fil_rev_8_21_14_0_10_45_20 TaxID=1974607 RepID=A0A2H0UGV2_9BACT|nr:MAG: hypothetical protein COU15_03020 [Candidatus Kaiserbacteria bacterium CG10_big_fil_rev_8_21_14_0_10_45_20]
MIIRTIKWGLAHKDRLATLALVLGFVMDVITFRNINLSLSQIILATHLSIVAGTIIIYALPVKGDKPTSFFLKVREWIPIVHQYSTGALLSAFLVLYTASGSLVSSAPFIVLLGVAIAGNEVLRLQKYRLPFQTTLFSLNVLLFFALSVPIFLGSVNAVTFVASVVVGAVTFIVFFALGKTVARTAFKKASSLIRAGAGLTLIVLVLLYFNNLIPPIPLSVKSGDFYHYVEKQGDVYFAIDERRDLLERFFAISGVTLHIAPGENVYFYSAVFAPARIDTNIVHHWQKYDEVTQKWTTHNKVFFTIQGGRKKGYRAYSLTRSPELGKWRVSVETSRGQIIGRTYLTLKASDNPRVPVEKFLQ